MGEVIRTQERLEKWTQTYEAKADSQYAMLQTSISTLTLAFVRADVYEAQQEALKSEVEHVKEIATWSFRLIAGVVLTALVLALIGVGKVVLT